MADSRRYLQFISSSNSIENDQQRIYALETELKRIQDLLALAEFRNQSAAITHEANLNFGHTAIIKLTAENTQLTADLAAANATIAKMKKDEEALIESGKRKENNNAQLRRTNANQREGLATKDATITMLNNSLAENATIIEDQKTIIATLQGKLKANAQKRRQADAEHENKRARTTVKQEETFENMNDANRFFSHPGSVNLLGTVGNLINSSQPKPQ